MKKEDFVLKNLSKNPEELGTKWVCIGIEWNEDEFSGFEWNWVELKEIEWDWDGLKGRKCPGAPREI